MEGFMSCIVKGVSGVRLPPKTQKHVGEGRRPLPEKCQKHKKRAKNEEKNTQQQKTQTTQKTREKKAKAD